LLVQKKVTKVNDTPYRLFPVLLIIMGDNRKLATLKQPIVEFSHNDCAARRGSRGYKKPPEILNFSLQWLFFMPAFSNAVIPA